MTFLRKTFAMVIGVLAGTGLIFVAIDWVDVRRICGDQSIRCDGLSLLLLLLALGFSVAVAGALVIWAGPGTMLGDWDGDGDDTPGYYK